MKYIISQLKTKRGNTYNVRRTKLATGFSKVNADRNKKRTGLSDEIDTLSVYGTLDHLAKTNYKVKQVQKESSIDKGYFKTVYVLTDAGKKRLKTMKQLKASNLPLWEYMCKGILIFNL